MAAWWGTRKAVSPRLWLEVQAMRESFGSTFKLVVPTFESLHWVGTVEINLSTVRTRSHTLKIVYPPQYPDYPPVAYVVRPTIRSRKHQYEDGQLCLFNPVDGAQYGWNPASSTATTIAAWAIQWLYAYYTDLATGRWPGLEESVYEETHRPPSWWERRSG